MVAVVRPDGWNFPLLVHVLGAMVLVGALVLAASALILAWRDGEPGAGAARIPVAAARRASRVDRDAGAAEWIASKEDVADANLAWVVIGYNTADIGLLLILCRRACRRSRCVASDARKGPVARCRRVDILVSLLLIVYLVAVWAMSTQADLRGRAGGC